MFTPVEYIAESVTNRGGSMFTADIEPNSEKLIEEDFRQGILRSN